MPGPFFSIRDQRALAPVSPSESQGDASKEDQLPVSSCKPEGFYVWKPVRREDIATVE